MFIKHVFEEFIMTTRPYILNTHNSSNALFPKNLKLEKDF